MSNQIKKLYKEYKQNYLNELYDKPLEFKKDSINKYLVYDENGVEIAYFLFTSMYDIDNSPINYKKYKQNKYWDISWYWSNINKKEKNIKNFIKVTSTSFKVVDDFLRSNNYPFLLGFGGLTPSHERIYSNELFIERWKNLFNERYYVEWKNDKLWLINKIIHRIDEHKISNLSIFFGVSPSQIYEEIKFPKKNKLRGISKQNFIKEQIHRIVLKQIYLK